ncbi:MAG: YciI family protein [Methylobacter sp.]|nr:YciI family protein [Methylobacter sp.]
MKFLCLAYGDEKDWLELTQQEQKELLAQDEVLRSRGAFMSAVKTNVTTVTAWDGLPTTTSGSFAKSSLPLAGFSIIEAADINEAVQLVAGTPCARAKGAIEIRPLRETDGG